MNHINRGRQVIDKSWSRTKTIQLLTDALEMIAVSRQDAETIRRFAENALKIARGEAL